MARRDAATSNRASITADDPLACCSPVSDTALDETRATVLAQSFAALSDPIRLRLLSVVASSPSEVCACDLVEPSGRSQSTVSHHMKILVDAGLVTREKRGLWVWYRVAPERLAALRAALA
ncbi:MAG: metalloregulator ArsR/SmtB family transcription factor [Ilumatobacteraceae bacterium]